MSKSTKSTKSVDSSKSTFGLDSAVTAQLRGGADLLLGQWLLAAFVSNAFDDAVANGAGTNSALDTIADTISAAFGAAARAGHATVDLDVVDAMPSRATVRALRDAAPLVPFVLSEDGQTVIAPLINKPTTVVAHARRADRFADIADSPGAFVQDYATVVEAANQNRKGNGKGKGKGKSDSNTDDESANPVVDRITKAINAAIEQHGLKPVEQSVLAALSALDAGKAAEAGKSAASSKAASARPKRATSKPKAAQA